SHSSTIDSPFIAGVAQWLKDIPVDGWELPVLTIGVAYLGFKLLEAGSVLAARLGVAIATALLTAPVEVSIATLAIAGIGKVVFTSKFWEELAAEWEAAVERISTAWGEGGPLQAFLQAFFDISSAIQHMAHTATDIVFGEMDEVGLERRAEQVRLENERRAMWGVLPLDPSGSLHSVASLQARLPESWASVVDLEAFAAGVAHNLKITLDAEDIRNIARMVQAEAEGEPYEGM